MQGLLYTRTEDSGPFFSKSEPAGILKNGSNIICTSLKNKHFLFYARGCGTKIKPGPLGDYIPDGLQNCKRSKFYKYICIEMSSHACIRNYGPSNLTYQTLKPLEKEKCNVSLEESSTRLMKGLVLRGIAAL